MSDAAIISARVMVEMLAELRRIREAVEKIVEDEEARQTRVAAQLGWLWGGPGPNTRTVRDEIERAQAGQRGEDAA